MAKDGLCAIVTGSASGLCAATAEILARGGARLVINYSSSQKEAEATAEACRKAGAPEVLIAQGDVSRDEDCHRIVAAAAPWGRLDVLVNNAGIQYVAPLEQFPLEKWDAILGINLSSAFHTTRAALPAMRKKGQGSFFFSNNSSSLRGRKRHTGQSLYYPRVMMRTLAQVLTEEYSEHGVHVANIVIDGSIDSPGSRALPRNQNRTDLIINPVKIAEAFWYLHTQDRSCWTHELQLTPFASKPSY